MKKTLKIVETFIFAAGLVMTSVMTCAQTQAWPEKPIRLINPFAAGGFGDTVARPFLGRLSQSLGQSIIVESHGGANGTLASNLVARAPADGYTLLLANLGPIAISPALQPATTLDPLKNFVAITQLVSGPLILLVHPDVPANNLKELLELARKSPGKLSYGSVGAGSTTHLAGELLSQRAGIDWLHVPYKGAAPVITNLLGKQIDAGIVNISLAKSYVESGKLKPIAVTTLKRSAVMPEVPAIAEFIPGFEVNPWWGLMAPIGTPRSVIERIQNESIRIIQLPEVAERFRQSGLEPEGTTAEAFDARIRGDLKLWRDLASTNKIVMD
jgi:tripartite-type tricarboxylate transporter receptor subunit TctC